MVPVWEEEEVNHFEERHIAAHIYRAALILAGHSEALFLAKMAHAKGDEEKAVEHVEKAESYRDEIAKLLAANSRTVVR